jgi:hypothetical protein
MADPHGHRASIRSSAGQERRACLRSCGQQIRPGTSTNFRRKTRAGASCATSATVPWFKEILIDDLDLPYNERHSATTQGPEVAARQSPPRARRETRSASNRRGVEGNALCATLTFRACAVAGGSSQSVSWALGSRPDWSSPGRTLASGGFPELRLLAVTGERSPFSGFETSTEESKERPAIGQHVRTHR